jgi:hypothetical protein
VVLNKEMTMIERRMLLQIAGALMLPGLIPRANAQTADLVTVYKSPTCGCCGEWVKHVRAGGLQVQTHDVGDVSPIRDRYGVPSALASCHTAIVAGYAIEGHVPMADIKRLLIERPNVLGLAVPGMVAGSPGMEQGTPQRYATLAFDARGYRVFAQH